MTSSVFDSEIEVPEGYDIKNLAESFIIFSGLNIPTTRAQDSIALILFHIQHRWEESRKDGKVGKRGLIPFHVEHRRKLIGINQDKYFTFLEDQEVILCNHNPLQGISATKYKVVLPRDKKRWLKYTITDKALIRRLNILKDAAAEHRAELNFKVSGLTSRLQSAHVEFKPEYKNELPNLEAKDLAESVTPKEQAEVLKYYRQLPDQIAMIEQGNYALLRDTKGYRLHSRIVRILKELRSYIQINSEPTREIDIKNSQPFFMTIVAQPTFWLPEKIPGVLHITDFDRNFRLSLGAESRYIQEVAHIVEGNSMLTTTILGKRDLLVEGRRVEVEIRKRSGSIILLAVYLTNNDEPNGLNFLSLARTGAIYDVLCSKYKGQFRDGDGNDLLKDRETAKVTVIKGLYNNPRVQSFKKYRKVIETLFPNFTLFTKLLKERGYKNLANLLQRVEASIFMEGALEEFIKIHPGCALITVHDSVLVPESYAANLKKHIETYIEQAVGFAPICTIK